jgi:hypothetical protein
MGLTTSKIDCEDRLNTLIIIYIDENMDEFPEALQNQAKNCRNILMQKFYRNEDIDNFNSDLHKFKKVVERDGSNSILDNNDFKNHLYMMVYSCDEYDNEIHTALLRKLGNIVIA